MAYTRSKLWSEQSNKPCLVIKELGNKPGQLGVEGRCKNVHHLVEKMGETELESLQTSFRPTISLDSTFHQSTTSAFICAEFLLIFICQWLLSSKKS